MQVSKLGRVARSYLLAVKMLFVVSCCAFILMWMNHSSINLYWQQKYHAPSPIESWDRYAYWAQGSKFTSALSEAKNTFIEQLATTSEAALTSPAEDNLPPEMALNETIPEPVVQDEASEDKTQNVESKEYEQLLSPSDPIPAVLSSSEESLTVSRPTPFTPNLLLTQQKLLFTQETAVAVHPVISNTQADVITEPSGIIESDSQVQPSTEATLPEAETTEQTSPYIAPTISLQAGDEVFFVGDSLMQGIAPHMINALRKNHQIHSINLSKQSTGLAYPSFFNWPKTVNTTLEKNQNIRLMLIFMGPNDPWNMPDKRGKPYLRFKSAEWENAYRLRVDAILEMAKQHNVQVIWIEAPNMRKKTLSSAMRYLSQIYQQETEKFRQLYVTTNDILGCEGDEYTNVIKLENNKRVKVRTDDGIHFSLIGQRRIADKLLSLIQVKVQEDDDQNT